MAATWSDSFNENKIELSNVLFLLACFIHKLFLSVRKNIVYERLYFPDLPAGRQVLRQYVSLMVKRENSSEVEDRE